MRAAGSSYALEVATPMSWILVSRLRSRCYRRDVPDLVSTWVDNALFFGAALVVLFGASFVVSRQAGRVVAYGLYAADKSDRAALQSILKKKVSRVVTLVTALLSLGLVTAYALLSFYEVDVPPRVWAWFQASFLIDRVALAWLLGELLGLVIVAVYVRSALRFFVGLMIERLRRNPAFVEHNEQLARVNERIDAVLRWGLVIAAVTAASFLLALPAAFNDPLRVVTYVVIVTLVARALSTVANLGVDIGVQLVRTLEDRPNALRYLGRLGRLDHVARITKRTIEYFCFIGAATFVVDQLNPDTWLSQSGLVAIRLIALVYVGRVVIEVIGLVLREVMLAEPEKRSEAENQQRLTLVPVASSILRYLVYFFMTVMALQELGVDTSPILAGAGLLGLAVGLGAQTLVGDVVSGFFILFEGLFLVGDRVRIGEVVGIVEEIGVRVLKVRDEPGVLHCIPNGEVRSVANHAARYVNAIVEFTIPYDQDVPKIMAAVKDHIEAFRPRYPDIIGETEIVIEDLVANGALIQTLTKVKPGRDEDASEAIRAEILSALTELGVKPQGFQTLRFDPKHPLALASGTRP